jgi:hypothetical protein
MKRVRLVLPEDLTRYLDRQWNAGGTLHSDALQIETIEDFRAYQTLITLALRGRRTGGLRRDDPLHRLLRGFKVELIGSDGSFGDDASTRIDNPYLHAPRFVLRRSGDRKTMEDNAV